MVVPREHDNVHDRYAMTVHHCDKDTGIAVELQAYTIEDFCGLLPKTPDLTGMQLSDLCAQLSAKNT